MLPSPVPTNTPLPIITKISPTVTPTVESLIEIIYASDPSLPQYDPNSLEYAKFSDTLKQISNMGAHAGLDAAGHLAVAINFPRSDSYLAAQTLLALGPNVTATAIPILIDNLRSEKPDVRIYSVILLGSIGKIASCAVGEIAPLLWDSNPRVRSAASLSLEMITEQDLVSSEYEITITPSFLATMVPEDTTYGSIVSSARSWWNEQGSEVNWHQSYGICDP